MGVKLSAAAGGSVELVPTNTASNYTATMPANTGTVVTTGSTAVVSQAMMATGVAGTGPAFSAYMSVTQSVTQYVQTKMAFNAESFDTASCFNNTGSTVGGIPAYAFLPNVAGYYQVNATGQSATTTAGQLTSVSIFKNGSSISGGTTGATSSNFYPTSYAGALIYLNGSTDYLEVYIYTTYTGNLPVDMVSRQTFSAVLVRGA